MDLSRRWNARGAPQSPNRRSDGCCHRTQIVSCPTICPRAVTRGFIGGGGGFQEQQGALQVVNPTRTAGGGGGRSRWWRCSSVHATPRGGGRCAVISCWRWKRRSGERLGFSPAGLARWVRGLGQESGRSGRWCWEGMHTRKQARLMQPLVTEQRRHVLCVRDGGDRTHAVQVRM